MASVLCLVWEKSGAVTIRREMPSFLRDFPSGFERDLRLRPPTKHTQCKPIPLFLCRHVATLPAKTAEWDAHLGHVSHTAQMHPPPHRASLVKSCMQKAIRRGLLHVAIAATSYLLIHEPKEVLRRLPIILVEDVGIFADLPKLMWLAVAVQNGYSLSQAEFHFILAVVAAAAMHPIQAHTPPASEADKDSAVRGLLQGPDPALPPQGTTDEQGTSLKALAQCLTVRACYGGMEGDVDMLLSFAATPALWAADVVPTVDATDSSLSESTKAWVTVASWLQDCSRTGRQLGGPLAPPERLDAAADFHCTDVVPCLWRFLRARQLSVPIPHEEEVKAAIWTHRSSINWRKDVAMPMGTGLLHSPQLPVWWDACTEAELVRLAQQAWTRQPVAGESLKGARAKPGEGADAQNAKRSRAGSGSRQLSLFRFAAQAPSLAAAGG